MFAKMFVCVLVLVCSLAAAVNGATIRDEDRHSDTKAAKDRIAALYVKDGNENGQLRFLTGSSGTTNINTLLNNYITQQQNALEQLRPTGTSTSTSTSTTTGTTSSSVTPIIVNLGSTTGSTTSTTSAVNSVINNSTPISSLLPQIIAQAVRRNPNTLAQQNRRRAGGNRRANQPQVFIIRP